MKMKHTPGQWTAEQQKNLASGKYEWVIKTTIDDVSSRIIATTPYASKYSDHEANAKLIEHSPELLDALKGMIRWAELTAAYHLKDGELMPKGLDKWKALIEKVEFK